MVIKAIKSFSNFTLKYPILRGMLSYSIIWPLSNIVQQHIQKREKFDFMETARFGLFGGLYVGPTVFAWVKLIGWAMPGVGKGIMHAMKKSVIEQILYSPGAICAFFVGMTLLEGKTLEDAKKEIALKFFPTYKANLCFWPFVQTLNFRFVPVRNRVSVSATASFFWAIVLSYMKQLEEKKDKLK